MSAVYKVTDPNLNRVVAGKLIHPHLSDNPEFVLRFREEATAVAQLRHPNIVQVFDFNNDDDIYYMIMEFVPGETLQARLKRLNAAQRHLSVTDAIEFAAQICDAAEYAHQRGMVHRDIKPANVILDINGQAILMDFGIAKIVGGQQHTATGATVGTALYMSPEQIRGLQVDGRSDIYSIGVTLFEMIRGRPPYEADSAMTLLMMHLNDPVPDLRQLRPETPPALVAVIEKALAKDRDGRFQSAAEMAVTLRAVGSPSAASPGPRTPVQEIPLAATVAETPPPGPPPAAVPAGSEVQPLESRPASVAGVGTGEKERSPSGLLSKLPLSPTLLAGVGAGLILLLILAFVLGGALSGGDDGTSGLAQGFTGTPTLQAEGDTATAQAQALNATGTAQALAAVASTTATPTAVAEPTATEVPTNTPVPPTATTAATATAEPPTATTAPVVIYTPIPTNTPLPGPYARINQITVQGNDYVVEYETIGFTETLEQWHTHFFFNTVDPNQAGVPGTGPWIVYYGPSPFRGYKVSDRPAGAALMCVRVANADHSLYSTPEGSIDTGNCAYLPPEETDTPTLTPTNTPTPGPYARINQITVQGDFYVVDYETIGFTETLDQWHTHFFYDTVSPDDAGVPGTGPWMVYYGPSPFREFTVHEQAPDATQICVRVANADHTLYRTPAGSIDTGNCVDLP
jgi:serine/threonine protein kinase